MSLLVDAFGGQVGGDRRHYLKLALRTFALDQFVALPVALIMTSAGLPFVTSYLVASIYSQSIGALCAFGTSLLLPALDRLTPMRGLAGVMGTYFGAGVAGAEIARRISALVLGPQFAPDRAYISWAIGATMALLVGVVLTTVRHLRTRMVSTELEALQARINPHFLFNTLNSIAELIREDPPRAEHMTLQLSSLFRYTLTAPRRGLVTLEEELTIVEGYLQIERERLGERLRYSIDVDPVLARCGLPALTLQPLVENAIRHGIAPSMAGGTVTVRGWRRDGVAHLTIADTGRGDSRQSGTGEGLVSVRKRLQATFGARIAVALTSDASGTTTSVTFPITEVAP